MKLTDRARTMLTNATVVAALVDQTITTLEESSGGYPTSTPGASTSAAQPSEQCHAPGCTNERPCDEHGDGVTLTGPERLAGQRDPAARDLDQLAESIRHAARHVAIAARICHRWGLAGVTDADVKAGLALVTRASLQKRVDDIWCSNCGKWGTRNVKLEGHNECDFCGEFRRDYGRPAPKELLEIFAYRRVSEQDKERVLDGIDPGWRKKARKGKVA